MHAETLAPLLRARPGTPEPAEVRAMPVILRIERGDPPARTPLLEAAAAAAVAVCLDDRTAPGGPWHEPVRDWIDAQIRKLARRARGAHWTAVEQLPGVTACRAAAQVRALLPHPVDETPHVVRRLQVSGTELPADDPGPPAAGEPVLWCNPHVPMSTGKLAAQVGHAGMLLAARLLADGDRERLHAWSARGYGCSVRTAGGDWAALLADDSAVPVRDAGYTEVPPDTVTVLARWC